MRDLFRQARSEMKQLPFMLGKLVGAAMAILGCSAAIVVQSGRPGMTASDAPRYWLAALMGIIIFVVSSRAMARRGKGTGTQTVPAGAARRMSVVSWVLLLLLATAFLLITVIITGGLE